MSVEREYPPSGKRDFVPTSGTDLSYTKTISHTYGSGAYTISVSSYDPDYPQFNPIECFNEADSVAGIWLNNNYTNGVYNGTESFDGGTYTGEWLKIKLPVYIQLTKIKIKQRSSFQPTRCPGDFKIYGSNDDTNWTVVVDKSGSDEVLSSDFTSYEYESTSVLSNTEYNYFVLVVNKTVARSGNTVLNFDEWYIYGKELPQYTAKSLISGSTDECIAFKYDSTTAISGQTEYTINFPEVTECDILIVGGGGAGGGDNAGGGGAGGLVFLEDIELNGEYLIKIGNGGTAQGTNSPGANGSDSSIEIISSSITIIDGLNKFIAKGGGGGGAGGGGSLENGNDGGSGGGTAYEETATKEIGETNQNSYVTADGIRRGWGFNGGLGLNYPSSQGSGGGGGGAGANGQDAFDGRYGAKGGDGFASLNGIDFQTHFQIPADIGEHIDGKVYFGGGGGGGHNNSYSSDGTNNAGGKGGGAGGVYMSGSSQYKHAQNNTGGGGGGGTYPYDIWGGAGGSGIVIIRYKTTKIITIDVIDSKLSSLLSLTPESNTLLYFDTSNTVNYLELDNRTLDITSNKLTVNNENVSNYVTGTSNILSSLIDIKDGNVSNYVDSKTEKTKNIVLLSDDNLELNSDFNIKSNLRIDGDIFIKGGFSNIETHVKVTDQFKVENDGTGPALEIIQTGSEDVVKFIDDTNTAFIIKDGGNIGINNDNPLYKLDINGDINIANGNNFRINGLPIATTDTTELVTDVTPQLGGDLDVNGKQITSLSNGDVNINPNGTGNVVIWGNTNGSGSIKLNCENNSHGVKIQGPPHSAGASYTLTLPTNVGTSNQVLSTDGSGGLSFVTMASTDEDVSQENWDSKFDTTTKNIVSVINAPSTNNLVYYTGSQWNNLALDDTTLEITTDNKLTVIGGGNLSSTSTSNVLLSPPSLVETVSSGLVAHYKFDGDLTNSVSGSSIGTLTSTNTSASFINTTGNYVFGKSALVNNTTLTIPSFHFSNLIAGTSKSFTVSFWFKANSISGTWNVLFDASEYYASDRGGIRVWINSTTKEIVTEILNGSGKSTINTTSLDGDFTDNKWRLYTFTYTYNSHSSDVYSYDIRFYENNQLNDGPDTHSTKLKNTGGFQIGDGNLYGIYPNEGYYDDLRIYDRALSAAEVEKLYLEGSDRGLIAHWKFDGDLVDEISSLTITTADSAIYPDGIFDEGLTTDGNKFVIDSSTLKDLVEGDTWTISFWINVAVMETSSTMIYLSRFDSSAAANGLRGGFSVAVMGSSNGTNPGKLRFERLYGTASWSREYTTFSFNNNLNKWVNCVIVCFATGFRVYMNGSLDTTKTHASSWVTTQRYAGTSYENQIGIGGLFMHSGWGNSSNDAHGDIDDLRFYDRELSAAEVEKLYNSQYIQKGSISNSTDKYIAFKYNPDTAVSNQTEYTINFPEDTECDILIVGGGGAGGGNPNGNHVQSSGGGGGGDVQYFTNVKLNGNYSIKVGNGSQNYLTEHGYDSEINNNNDLHIIASGGDSAGTSHWNGSTSTKLAPKAPRTFTSPVDNNLITTEGGGGGGARTNGSYTVNPTTRIYSGSGGTSTLTDRGAGGGGALQSPEGNGTQANGGSGIQNNISGTIIGYGGGGSGSYGTLNVDGGGKSGENGINDTGGGGGGNTTGSYAVNNGTKGGSGIVIIRYKTTKIITIDVIDPKLSSLSSLTPESNTLLYFDTSNTVNYLELDNTTLDITSNKLTVNNENVSNYVTGTSNILSSLIDIKDGNVSNYVDSKTEKTKNIVLLSDDNLELNSDFNIKSNLRIDGDIFIKGGFSNIETHVKVTDQFKVENDGTGPALEIIQTGSEDVVKFIDDTNTAFIIKDGGNIGINNDNPLYKLDINGDINIANGNNFRINGLPIATTDTTELVTDVTPQLGGDLDVNGKQITSLSNGDVNINPNGTGNVVIWGNTNGSGSIKLNCENNSHGVKIQGPPHSAGASYTLTLPTNVGTLNQVLSTDGNGVLSFVTMASTDEDVSQENWDSKFDTTTKNIVSVINAPSTNDLVYYTGSQWNNLALDDTTLEITTDNKLSVIGGTTDNSIKTTSTLSQNDLVFYDGSEWKALGLDTTMLEITSNNKLTVNAETLNQLTFIGTYVDNTNYTANNDNTIQDIIITNNQFIYNNLISTINKVLSGDIIKLIDTDNTTIYKKVYESFDTYFTIYNNAETDVDLTTTYTYNSYIKQNFKLLFDNVSIHDILLDPFNEIQNINETIITIYTSDIYKFSLDLVYNLINATDFCKLYVKLTRSGTSSYIKTFKTLPIMDDNNYTFTNNISFLLNLEQNDIITIETNYKVISGSISVIPDNRGTNIIHTVSSNILLLNTETEVTTTQETTSNLLPPSLVNMSVERMYPPTRNLASASHTISGQTYGNGLYETWESSIYAATTAGYSAFNISNTMGYHGDGNQYVSTSGVFDNSNFDNDGGNLTTLGYTGDWIKIKLPVYINLTKYALKQRPLWSSRAPKDYRIYGSNDNNTWTILEDRAGVNAITSSDYNSLLYETSVSTTGEYQYFLIIVNELLGNDHTLNLDEWYIYGKENFTTADGLIAHYKFDGNYNDSSGNNYHLTNHNASTQSTHIIDGEAVEFDNSDYLEFPSQINPYTIWNGNGITFSFWFRVTSSGTWGRFIDFQVAASTDTGILIARHQTSNNIRILMNETITVDVSLTNILDSTWHHFTFSVDTSGVWTSYLDNVNQNISKTQAIPNISYNLRYINKSVYPSDGNWDGQMDDFRIYDRALSAEEVEKLYLEGSDRGLIAHYKFDDNTNVGLDSSGNGYDLTAKDGTVQLSSTYSVFNSSSYYTSDSLESSAFTFDNKSFAVSVWTYYTGTGNIITQHKSPTKNQSFHCQVLASNGIFKYRLGFFQNDLTTSDYDDSNKWIHLVFQIDASGEQEIYRNGVKIGNRTSDSSAFLDLSGGTYNVIVGDWLRTQDYYDGYLDDLRIYDRALSAAEVEKLYYAQYIQTGSISGSTDEYIAFKYNPNTTNTDIVYDFGLQSISSVATFASYANTIPGISGVSSFNNWNSSGIGGVGAYPNAGNPPGKIQIQLPSTHNTIKVEYQNVYSSGSSIINMYVDTKTNLDNATSTPTDSISGSGSSSFETHYNTNDYLQIEDPVSSEGILGRDLKITLSDKQTEYTINFPQETECDILIVGGGGGGGTVETTGTSAAGAGGGGGGVIFLENQTVSAGTYTIKVGNGGEGDLHGDSTRTTGQSGYDSSFSYLQTKAIGGGGGGTRFSTEAANTLGLNGGSGGGSVYDSAGNAGGSGTVSNILKADGTTILASSYRQGYDGGLASADSPFGSGGGGAGGNGYGTTDTPDDSAGGIGRAEENGIDFKTHFNIQSGMGELHTDGKVYFAGGGAGGYRATDTNYSAGGLGGGGNSSSGASENGTPHTGGGGGGARSGIDGALQKGGQGGSGIVIIRYATQKTETITVNTTNNIGVVQPKLTSLLSLTPEINSLLYFDGIDNINYLQLDTETLELSNNKLKVIGAGSNNILPQATTGQILTYDTNEWVPTDMPTTNNLTFIGSYVDNNNYIDNLEYTAYTNIISVSNNHFIYDSSIINANKLKNGDIINLINSSTNASIIKKVYNSTETYFTIYTDTNIEDTSTYQYDRYIKQNYKLLFNVVNTTDILENPLNEIENITETKFTCLNKFIYNINVNITFDLTYGSDLCKFYIKLVKNNVESYINILKSLPITDNLLESATINYSLLLNLELNDIITFETNYKVKYGSINIIPDSRGVSINDITTVNNKIVTLEDKIQSQELIINNLISRIELLESSN
jgi:hypothetical protein